jgi:5-methylthioadenosine/S-adenosylhomocysteine deaminase
MMAAVTRFAERWLPYAPMITPAFFCHSPYTCSPQTLVNVKAAARAAGIKAPANPGIRRCPYQSTNTN